MYLRGWVWCIVKILCGLALGTWYGASKMLDIFRVIMSDIQKLCDHARAHADKNACGWHLRQGQCCGHHALTSEDLILAAAGA